jgi:hypothetical protein
MNCFRHLLPAILLFGAVASHAAVYTGSLSYVNDVKNGFQANASALANSWRQSSVLSWEVSNEASGGPVGLDWRYIFTLDVFKFVPTTWVIETGLGFTTNHMGQVSVTGAAASSSFSYEVGLWEKAGDAQRDFLREMPEKTYGILFKNTSVGGESTAGAITITFWSDAAPVWGDLYANCGGNGNRGWNDGFSTADPLEAPSSGSLDNHVLTPGAIPEPTVVGLLSIAAFGMIIGRRLFDPELRQMLFSKSSTSSS